MPEEAKTPEELLYEINYLRILVADLENKHRQSEDLVRVVTEQYRRVTEVVSDYVFSVHIVDGNPVETVHGKGCFAITGYKPEEFSANRFLWINMVHNEDRAFVLGHVAGLLSGKDTAPFEHRIIRKDGAIRWVRNTPVCQYDSEGKLTAYDGLIQDITDSRQDSEKLSRNERKYRIIADFTYDWEEWIAPDGHYLYVSPSCERITGYRPDEFIGNPDLITLITHPADQAKVAAHYNDIPESDRGTHTLDFRIVTRNGDVRWISHNCQSIFTDDGVWLGHRASNRDISKRRRLMEELLKVRQLEAIGILAGGIAHDFNNLLTAILGNISMAKALVKPEDKISSFLSCSEAASLKARDLTQQLLTFAGGSAPVRQPVALDPVLRGVVHAELEGAPVVVELDLHEGLRPVLADLNQVTEAFRNLLINAREAMPDGGAVRIAAENVVVDEESALSLPWGQYVKVDIADTGVGIPEEHAAKIYDPYFTTKGTGPRKGVGLGLAIAYSVVRGHEGLVAFDSEVGKGTTFHVYLPAADNN